MFCPECKSEYVPGITECADCHVPLVAELPVEEAPVPEPVEWAPLATTSYRGDIALIKSLLESEGIRYWVQGEFRGFASGVIIHVDQSRIDEARDLIQDLNLNPVGYSTRRDNDLP